MERIRNRHSGVICHPTSFPGPHGIGDFGEAAFRFVDWLARGRQTLWQVLPLGPIGLGNSPYASPSAFAGNELLISLPWLAGDGLLDPASPRRRPAILHVSCRVRRGARVQAAAAARGVRSLPPRRGAGISRPAFDAFREEQAGWLDDYATFMALKSAHDDVAWSAWPTGIALRERGRARSREGATAETRSAFTSSPSSCFTGSGARCAATPTQRGIAVVGDLPIFVAYDSADVWAHRDLFRLDRQGRPTVVAGVPPDAFTAEGQFWGNPVYDWERNAETGYAWWIDRVRSSLQQVDVLRIDHFRAFAASWVVPGGCPHRGGRALGAGTRTRHLRRDGAARWARSRSSSRISG